ncbi:hypothetical protein HZS61_007375 [Fusarium oxysporum f. sp. conglutinans]|uniref:HTH CENPB-type domain-containing protein n=1 Tax=Fusarium oxysporum f. sp. conglutinans TaxID=100902 RepID=A0A8H6G8F9_FUSOX|nr:hypothetical protein HZS61_007375 [Fusarium oxysporum f. sp. conglutinans]
MVFHLGVWGYRYEGVYYSFYKQCDEEELPQFIADKISQGSPTYDDWLKQKRKECEKLKQLRKDALLVSLEPLECAVSPENLENHAFPGFERLYSMPSHTSPRFDFKVLISVFIDLDHQSLVVEKSGGSWSFPLNSLPRELGKLQPTMRSEEPPVGDEDEGTVASWGVLVSRMFEVLRIVSQVYNLVIAQACNAGCEKGFLFRQVGYMVLSIASCDRKNFNLVDAEQLKLPYTAVDRMDKLTRIAYGILEGGGNQQPRELVPTLLSGYHDGRKSPGSAPSTTSYWMGSVFVYLTATKLSKLPEPEVENIVKEAVAKGREVKPEFRMIVFSIWDFILVEVTPETVAPSQCQTLWTSHPASPADDNGEPKFRMFLFEPHRNFAKLACFFLHKDRSDDLTGFGISRKLRVVNQNNGALSSLPLPGKEDIEREGLLTEWNLEEGQSDSWNRGLGKSKRRKINPVQHIPIILPINKERPPSMLSVLVPWGVCRGSPPAEENEKKRAKTQLWNDYHCGRLRKMLKDELKSKKSKESSIRESLQIFLVKYDKYGVTLHAKAVAMLHAHLLYIPYGIGGSKDNQSYAENVDITHPYHILEISIGAHLIVAFRNELVRQEWGLFEDRREKKRSTTQHPTRSPHWWQSRQAARQEQLRLTTDQEDDLERWILRQEKLGHAPTHAQVRTIVRSVLARHGDHAPLGRKWTTRFVERHPALKTKLGRRTDWERVNAATPANIKRLFDVYETVDWIPPERQYNADEGGIMEGQGVNGLVIGSSQESPNAVPVKTATSEGGVPYFGWRAYRSDGFYPAHFQPASEDTAEGWERAELEARRQAKKEYLRNAYLCWTKNEKTDEQRIAILVVIGTKFKVLCVDKQPKLPTRTETPPDGEVNGSWYYDPWESCSNMQPYLCRAWTELTFGYANGREQPYDLKDAKDEGAIIKAMEWLVEQAESCDPTGWEGIVRQGANLPYRIGAAG